MGRLRIGSAIPFIDTIFETGGLDADGNTEVITIPNNFPASQSVIIINLWIFGNHESDAPAQVALADISSPDLSFPAGADVWNETTEVGVGIGSVQRLQSFVVDKPVALGATIDISMTFSATGNAGFFHVSVIEVIGIKAMSDGGLLDSATERGLEADGLLTVSLGGPTAGSLRFTAMADNGQSPTPGGSWIVTPGVSIGAIRTYYEFPGTDADADFTWSGTSGEDGALAGIMELAEPA